MAAVGIVVALGVSETAEARQGIYNAWAAEYPESLADDNVIDGTGAVCQLCHQSSGGGNGWNGYGWQIRIGIEGGASDTDAIIAAEIFDSDLDPGAASNGTEISNGSQPGWTPGSVNSIFFKDGSVLNEQAPPAISGDLDPAAAPVPSMGPWAWIALVAGTSLLGSTLLERRARGPRGHEPTTTG
jgi:hypothetical protein